MACDAAGYAFSRRETWKITCPVLGRTSRLDEGCGVWDVGLD